MEPQRSAPCSPGGARAGRKQPSWLRLQHHRTGPEVRAWLARTEDFPIPCPALRCSLICPLYFYLSSLPAPGLSAFARLLMALRPGSAVPVQLQLKASLLGTGLAVRLRAPRLSSCLPSLRLAPNDASLPTRLSACASAPPWSPISSIGRRGGGSKRPSVARGPALVPEPPTDAPFRTLERRLRW